MSNWNDNIDTTLSFKIEINEEGRAYFERMLKDMKDQETAIRERIEQLFGEYVMLGGEKKDEAYQDLLKLFTLGYQLGWNDRYSLDKKEGEQKPPMIQWTGNNLKELVQFTGKSPKFDEWFKTWEDFENYVHTHNNIFKIFNEDGSHIEIPVGAWIVKTPDGYNVASRYVFKQKGQIPIRWSEEDEKMLNSFIHRVEFGFPLTKDEYLWILKKLKSLRPRITSQSKPEEES